jgi:hypothetical protein
LSESGFAGFKDFQNVGCADSEEDDDWLKKNGFLHRGISGSTKASTLGYLGNCFKKKGQDTV